MCNVVKTRCIHAAVVIHAQGRLVGRSSKVHAVLNRLGSNGQVVFECRVTPGDAYNVFNRDFGRILYRGTGNSRVQTSTRPVLILEFEKFLLIIFRDFIIGTEASQGVDNGNEEGLCGRITSFYLVHGTSAQNQKQGCYRQSSVNALHILNLYTISQIGETSLKKGDGASSFGSSPASNLTDGSIFKVGFFRMRTGESRISKALDTGLLRRARHNPRSTGGELRRRIHACGEARRGFTSARA